MKIMNIMLSRILGGIEQSFLDYSNLIEMSGFQPINVISQDALVAERLPKANMLANYFQYDPVTLYQLHKLIRLHKPAFILAHGSRAMNNAAIARIGTSAKLIGVSHQYKIRALRKCNHVIAITKHMKSFIDERLNSQITVDVIEHSVNVSIKYKPIKFRQPVIFGAMGRLVAKKGFEIFLQALSVLYQAGVEFKAVIGGDGYERENLQKLTTQLMLDEHVTFAGWVDDKQQFFDNIDIFCLPSIHEPFGIILLEAMSYAKPIITTDSEGPAEIITAEKDGLFVSKANVSQLAEVMMKLLNNLELAKILGQNAQQTVKDKYDTNTAVNKFKKLIHNIK